MSDHVLFKHSEIYLFKMYVASSVDIVFNYSLISILYTAFTHSHVGYRQDYKREITLCEIEEGFEALLLGPVSQTQITSCCRREMLHHTAPHWHFDIFMECQGIDNTPLLHSAAALGASEESVALLQQVKPAVYKDFQESAWSCTINKKLVQREFCSSSQLVFNLSVKNIHTQPIFLSS